MNEEQSEELISVLRDILRVLEVRESKNPKNEISFNFLRKRNDLLTTEIYPNLSDEDKKKVMDIKIRDCY